MSEKISLKKREETLKISLKKKNIADNVILRVGSALDISSSMHSLYRSGAVSDFVGKLLPFGMKFDDNEQIDMWAFDHDCRTLPPATADVYDDYVGNCMSGISISGGTAYAPVMESIYDEYFGKKVVSVNKTETVERPASGFFSKLLGKKETVEIIKTEHSYIDPDDTTPAMIFFQTDGENGDQIAVRRLLEKHKNTPVYWFMVGVGNSSFSFLKELARDYPNVDFISINDLALSDEDLYDKLLSKEFGEWIKKMGVKNA